MSDRRQAHSPGHTYELDPLTAADLAVMMGDKSAGRRDDPDSSSTDPVHGKWGAVIMEREHVPTGPFTPAYSFPGEVAGQPGADLVADGLRIGGAVAPTMIEIRSSLI